MKKNIFILCSLLFVLYSCHTAKDIKYIDRVQYIDRLKYDSVYVYKFDSIYILQKNDTVYIQKFRTLYKDKISIRRDTVNIKDSVIFDRIITKNILVPRKITPSEKMYLALGHFSFYLLLIALFIFIVKYYNTIKLYLKKLLHI